MKFWKHVKTKHLSMFLFFGLTVFFTNRFLDKYQDVSLQYSETEPKVPELISRIKIPAPEFPLNTAGLDAAIYREVHIPDRSSFYMTLINQKVEPQTVLKITEAAKDTFDLSELAPGTRVVLSWSKQKLDKLRVLVSGKEELQLGTDAEGDWQASLIEHEVKIELAAYFGNITSTLWDSAVNAGMPFELISDLSDIFASQVDFTRELNVDDQWSILVEKQMVGAQQVGFGNILAAEISKHGETLPAFRFANPDGHTSYFDAEGQSARGKFLKSPLRYSKITSRFQKTRFHPILRVSRAHKGVDFAAPRGTPVRSVGDGIVVEAGRSGGSGIMLKLRHDSRYMTAYKHLSKISPGLHKGSRVDQGQIIGFVGSTGLATGPHLHFEFYEDSRYVDPLGKRFPRRDSLDPKYKAQFKEEVKRLTDLLQDFRKKSKAF